MKKKSWVNDKEKKCKFRLSVVHISQRGRQISSTSSTGVIIESSLLVAVTFSINGFKL